jgi:hypothetical protein|tara:strand:- start:2870 stop:3409 length:540 start_codon:yes stop_codon:yes gene_type:complete
MSYNNRKIIWKPTAHEDYIVSNTGEVTSLKYYNKDKKYQRTLSQNPDKDGYKTVTIYPNKTYIKAKVHRLVALAFCKGRGASRNMALHRDGNKNNNHAHNLYWGNAKDNKADSIKHGTNKGDWTAMTSPSRILQPRNVIKIRRLLKEGKLKLSEIAKMYNVHYKTIYDIKVGKTWKSIS